MAMSVLFQYVFIRITKTNDDNNKKTGQENVWVSCDTGRQPHAWYRFFF